MNKEINLIEMVKAQRYFTSALKMLLSRERRLSMIEQSRNLIVSSDNETSEKEQKLEKEQ